MRIAITLGRLVLSVEPEPRYRAGQNRQRKFDAVLREQSGLLEVDSALEKKLKKIGPVRRGFRPHIRELLDPMELRFEHGSDFMPDIACADSRVDRLDGQDRVMLSGVR